MKKIERNVLQTDAKNYWKISTVFLVLLFVVSSALYTSMMMKKSELKTTTSPSPQINSGSNLKTYSDRKLGFQFQYPANISLTTIGDVPVLRRKITWFIDKSSLSDQRGDGPLIKSQDETNIAGKKAKRFFLEYGSVGGIIPESAVRYEVPFKGSFLVFVLNEIPIQLTPEEIAQYPTDRLLGPISNEEKRIFDQIVSSVHFSN